MKLMIILSMATIGFAQNNDCDTLEKCQEALKTNRANALIHFRIGEIQFSNQNFQAAANEFRESLSGKLDPPWIEVWAHVNLGKIFDVSQQRERALNEYRLALRTKDNTRGAMDEAKKFTETPYSRSERN
jgi:tetratricopeptide (TPR) repeat protein